MLHDEPPYAGGPQVGSMNCAWSEILHAEQLVTLTCTADGREWRKGEGSCSSCNSLMSDGETPLDTETNTYQASVEITCHLLISLCAAQCHPEA